MAFAKFKEQSLLKRFQKELRNAPETRTPNAKEIHSVAILTNEVLYSSVDIVNQVKSNIKSVRTVQIYSYKNFKKSDVKSYKHFTEKDFDWKGKIKDPSLESFIENPFDLLIGYFDKKHLYLEYATLKSQATFKIGLSKVNDKIFDLVVAEDPVNIDSFIEVIKKYLTLLNKI
jgi:hypothetical protein